jgi:hypothetical protein
MDPSPSALTMTRKRRTSTWKIDYGMEEILPRCQKKPVKWFNSVQKINETGYFLIYYFFTILSLIYK